MGLSLADFTPKPLGQVGISAVTGSDAVSPVDPVPAPEWHVPIDHLSATSLAMLQTCPRQFQQRYIKRIKKAPAGALVLGKAVHGALDYNFRCKAHTDKDLPEKVLAEYYQDMAWPRVLGEHGGVDSIRWDGKPGEILLMGEAMACTYVKNVAPRVQPHMGEVEVKVDIPGVPVPVIGYIDLVQQGDLPVIDWKTASTRQSKIKPEWRLQGRIYNLAAQKPVDWHVLTKQRSPQVVTPVEAPDLLQPHSPEIDEETRTIVRDLARLCEFYYQAYGEDEDWPALGVGHPWKCGWCGYQSDCPAWKGVNAD